MNPLDVVYVTAQRCHFCERGRVILAELATRYPLRVREVDLGAAEGRTAAERWMVPYPPIVIVDGELAGYGRLSARGLERFLAGRLAASSGGRR